MLRLLRPYRGLIALLLLLGLLSNGASLILPHLIGLGINSGVTPALEQEFALAACAILLFNYLQNLIQVYASEKVAFDLRSQLSVKISRQSYAFVLAKEPSVLLTNLTSDVDSVKLFVSQAISSILSSLVILVGASVLLLSLNWRLGLTVLTIIPIIATSFGMVLGRVRKLFSETRKVIDRLNKVINESILGAALVRVLDARQAESAKFGASNARSRDLGVQILSHFAALIPIVVFVSNLATLAILMLGGRFVMDKSMTIGDLAAFNSYLGILIFPIFVIGFMSNLMAQTRASYTRLALVLDAPDPESTAPFAGRLEGRVEVDQVTLLYGERAVLRDVSMRLQPGTRNAIIGPTAAGKTQLLYLLAGLCEPSQGTVRYDGLHRPDALSGQVAMVFQESILFHTSLRENVAFSPAVTPEGWKLAVETAELHDFMTRLPEGPETIVSERGTSLSGGQKQRVMLARALALRPNVLLLDDFTARLDPDTERKILANLERNYPGMTLLAVTQRIATVQNYDHIVLMMEGQVLAEGTHAELLEQSPEYMQIYESQRSTQQYE